MVELVYAPNLAEYRLSESHPLRPERFSLAIELMRAWNLICDAADQPANTAEYPAHSAAAPQAAEKDRAPCATLIEPVAATDEDLERVHDRAYIDAVRSASADPAAWPGAFGIGPGDTPAFAHMHEASAEVAGATIRALDDVVAERCTKSLNPAGGLHHAHRACASGFCVYNDPAIAIARATANTPGLRVAYVDVDAHHGDGVQEAFFDRDDVLTISVHESGHYLFPGTGDIRETGEGPGEGFSVNLPLPPGADDACLALAFERVIAPAVRAFSPDVIVAQLGADSHRADPLTHLAATVGGHYRTTQRINELADEVCDGRITATGGGGYDSFSAVPRAWACALAALLGVPVPDALPESWHALAVESARRAGAEAHLPYATLGEVGLVAPAVFAESDPVGQTEQMVTRLRALHPLLRDAG